MRVAIWWIRRDLRFHDNQALNAALEKADAILPVFIFDQKLISLQTACEKRIQFMLSGLRQLDEKLRSKGSYLIVREGEPSIELSRLLNEFPGAEIFSEPDYSYYARARDEKVTKELPVNWVGSPAALPPGIVLQAGGKAYTVFTAFSKAWKVKSALKSGLKFHSPDHLRTPPNISGIPFPVHEDNNTSFLFKAGEDEALRKLGHFMQGFKDAGKNIHPIFQYADLRNRLDLSGSSMLSPYLRFGMVSARQAVVAALDALQKANSMEERNSAEMWLNELIWRDFYLHVLYNFPHVSRGNFRLQSVRWENNLDHYDSWKNGTTCYPIVDASMRQLQRTGWMHNRGRMIVGSFLTKDLLVDWRWGEKWFMQNLVDGDPSSNNGGWQWIAGTGTDAAPYFRIFNPVSQSMKHDPEGLFIRRWLPELQDVPSEYVHEPWKMPMGLQRAIGVIIGKDYPKPIVDHAESRRRVLKAFGRS
jgi:deoxyribodipyrimidine photo-lyase